MNNILTTFISKLLFFSLLIITTLALYEGYKFVDNHFIIFGIKLNAFDFVLGPIIFLTLKKYIFNLQSEKGINKIILQTLLFYFIYQIVIVAPLTLIEYPNEFTIKNLVRGIINRSYFIIIPFLYWYVYDKFTSVEKIFKYLLITSLILFYNALYIYITGEGIEFTPTGQIRSAQAFMPPAFVFLIIIYSTTFGAKKNNLIFILIGILGIIFSAYRSALLALGIILILSFIFGRDYKNIIKTSLLFSLGIFILSQYQFIWEQFIGRFSYTFDAKETTAADRLLNWAASFNYFLKNPLNGSLLTNQYYESGYGAVVWYSPHNFIIEILSTQGIVGLFFHSIILYYVIKIGYRNLSDKVTSIMFYYLVFYLIFSFLNATYFTPFGIQYFCIAYSIILYRNKILNHSNAKTL